MIMRLIGHSTAIGIASEGGREILVAIDGASRRTVADFDGRSWRPRRGALGLVAAGDLVREYGWWTILLSFPAFLALGFISQWLRPERHGVSGAIFAYLFFGIPAAIVMWSRRHRRMAEEISAFSRADDEVAIAGAPDDLPPEMARRVLAQTRLASSESAPRGQIGNLRLVGAWATLLPTGDGRDGFETRIFERVFRTRLGPAAKPVTSPRPARAVLAYLSENLRDSKVRNLWLLAVESEGQVMLNAPLANRLPVNGDMTPLGYWLGALFVSMLVVPWAGIIADEMAPQGEGGAAMLAMAAVAGAMVGGTLWLIARRRHVAVPLLQHELDILFAKPWPPREVSLAPELLSDPAIKIHWR